MVLCEKCMPEMSLAQGVTAGRIDSRPYVDSPIPKLGGRVMTTHGPIMYDLDEIPRRSAINLITLGDQPVTPEAPFPLRGSAFDEHATPRGPTLAPTAAIASSGIAITPRGSSTASSGPIASGGSVFDDDATPRGPVIASNPTTTPDGIAMASDGSVFDEDVIPRGHPMASGAATAPTTFVVNEDGSMPKFTQEFYRIAFFEKLNYPLLRNVPDHVWQDLHARAAVSNLSHGNAKTDTASILIHLLYNPGEHKQMYIPGCNHQHEELQELLDDLVALYGPKTRGARETYHGQSRADHSINLSGVSNDGVSRYVHYTHGGLMPYEPSTFHGFYSSDGPQSYDAPRNRDE